MNRRSALKNLTLTLGYAVATPTVLNVLQSCQTNEASLVPNFFTPLQGFMIRHLVDIIIPKTDVAGALDVNVPEFMDKMLHEIAPEEKKNEIMEGAIAFSREFEKVYGKEVLDGSKKEYRKILSTYFDISEEEKKSILKSQKSTEAISQGEMNNYLIYKFLLATRTYTITGYFSSELVGEKILSYDPVPGAWEPCIPVEDIGNAWSLI